MKINIPIFLLLFFSFLSSCKKDSDKTILDDTGREAEVLSHYFSAATIGVISAADPLRYVLKSPLPSSITEEMIQDLIQINPTVSGKITLSNQSIITFTPNVALKPNTQYEITILFKSLGLKEYTSNPTYTVRTFKQDLVLEQKGFVIHSNGNVAVLVRAKTADKVNEKDLEKCFQTNANTIKAVSIDKNVYDIEILFDAGIPPNAYVKYNGSPIYCNASGEIDLLSYSSETFAPAYIHNDILNKEFNIYFSQILSTKKDLSGLIKVNGQNVQYAINDNILTINLGDYRNVESVEIALASGILSSTNQETKELFNYSISVNVDKPEVVFLGEGNYFPSSGDFKIPIKTRALQSLILLVVEIKNSNVHDFLAWQSLYINDFYTLRTFGKPIYKEVVDLSKGIPDEEGWIVHGIDLSKQVERSPGSIYVISAEFTPENINLVCKSDLIKYNITSKLPSIEYFTHWNTEYNEYRYYPYDWQERGNPCNIAFYAEGTTTSKVFICSDYGIIAKKAGADYHIALTGLKDLSPLSGSAVTLFDMQGDDMGSTETNSQGFAEIRNTKQDAAVLEVNDGIRRTYLRLHPAEVNDVTSFDLNGERSENDTDFFVYTERDVWRPGDSIFIDLMVNKKNANIPKGMPAVLEFFNTDNLLIYRTSKPIDLDKNSIYNFILSTPSGAKTGMYRTVIHIGPRKLYKNIRIETVKPNSTQLNFTYNKAKDGTIYSDKISGSLNVQYLTGFDIENAKVHTVLKWQKTSKAFQKFEDYTFDVNSSAQPTNVDLFDVTTDALGKAAFSNNTSFKYINYPANLSIESEVTLPGGGVNKQGNSISISPFESYVGLTRNKGTGWYNNYKLDENIEIQFVNLNKDFTLNTSNNVISYTVSKHIKNWWIDKYRLRSGGNYTNNSYWENSKEGFVNVKGKGSLTFRKGELTKGAYKLFAVDKVSGHQTEIYFTVYDGTSRIPGTEPFIVDFEIDKEEINVGDEITVKFPAFENAKALVSIERGNRILDKVWFTINAKSRELKIQTNEDWAPNVYVNVTVIQPYMQDDNDLPIRLYGIRHISVNNGNVVIQPKVDAPDKLESNKNYTFTVSEEKGLPMEYTLALVDEGLLNLTGFSTPDPEQHFMGKYPLLVQTWDIYKWLMQYFKGNYAGILSIGGDNAYNPDALAEVSRYKAIVMHQGPFKLDKNGNQKHTIEIPNYIGQLRLMIVAIGDGKFGKLQENIAVKNPIMLQSQFPRSLYLSDQFQLPITILRDDKSIATASLTAKANKEFISGFTASEGIKFTNGDQSRHIYNLEVGNKTGVIDIDLTVSGKGKSMSEETEIAINYPNSYESNEESFIIDPGKSHTIKPELVGFTEAFTSTLSIGGFKMPNFAKYAQDLIQYPYGCLEQIVSLGYSQLYLDKVMALDPEKNRSRLENLQTVFLKLNRLQQSDGKFRYWENGHYNSWADIYAGHFLADAVELGYIPNSSQMVERWSKAHERIAGNWAIVEASSSYVVESESMIQAYRLYVLAKMGNPNKSAMNRFISSNKSNSPIIWWLLAGAYEDSGYDSKARELIKKAENLQSNYNGNLSYYTLGSRPRDWTFIVEILSRFSDLKEKTTFYYDEMVNELNGWVNTHTKGFSFMATYKYFGVNLNMADRLQYNVSGKSTFEHPYMESKSIALTSNDFGKNLQITNQSKSKIFVKKTDRYIDKGLIKPASNKNLSMNVLYTNKTKGKAGLEGMVIGDDIEISVTINNTLALNQENLALNLKAPSGWELINPRIYETDAASSSQYDYQDFKDDRVYTFFSISAGKSKTFRFRAKAAFTGNFFMPSISCEHMYKGNVFAISKTGRTQVSKG